MNVQKVFRSLALATLLGIGFIAPAQAAFISVQPTPQSVLQGATPGVDVVVTGLGPTETVGGFSFELTYNPSILQATGITEDPNSVMVPGGHCFSCSTLPLLPPGVIDIAYTAGTTLTQAQLKTNEGAGFTLAHVNFLASGLGTSNVNLGTLPSNAGAAFLASFGGVPPITATPSGGVICVNAPGIAVQPCVARVPEPGSLALLALGGLAIGAVRRRRSA